MCHHPLVRTNQGTGKTVCLISLITSYQFANPEVGKLIYCTRTVPEMMKCIEELKRVIAYRAEQLGPEGEKAREERVPKNKTSCVFCHLLLLGVSLFDNAAYTPLCRKGC